MKDERHLLQPFLSESAEKVFNSYEKYGLNRYNAVYDRSNSIPHFLNIQENVHPFPTIPENFNKSFYDISEQRCKELLSLNKPIYVMWSGGLDSTYALFLLHPYFRLEFYPM